MKGLYTDILNQQDFGFQDQYHIDKRIKVFQDATKLINSSVKVFIYKIVYGYKTKRGNTKNNYKILVLNHASEIEAKRQLLDYIHNLNIKYPYRAISNVKILDVVYEEILVPLI